MIDIKKIKILTTITILFLIGIYSASACEITFDVIDGKKEVYSAGDVLVVKVKVTFTHRVCPEGIEATKFKYDGFKFVGATKWVNTQGNIFERKVKLEVENTKKEKNMLSATRTCDKTGGYGEIFFKIK